MISQEHAKAMLELLNRRIYSEQDLIVYSEDRDKLLEEIEKCRTQ